MRKFLALNEIGFKRVLSVLRDNNFDTRSTDTIADEILRQTKSHNSIRVLTLNLQILRLIYESDSYFQNVKHSNYWLADGWPIAKILNIKNNRISRRTGADLVSEILTRKHSEDISIGYIGGNQLLRELVENNNDLNRVKISCIDSQHFNFPIEKSFVTETSTKILAANCNLVLVAVGSPKQDWLIHELSKSLENLTYLPCGAALDFHFGLKKRAPLSFQKLNLEWMWRLLTEPKRLPQRYIKDLIFLITIYCKLRKELSLENQT